MRALLRSILALSVVVLVMALAGENAPTVRANLDHCEHQVPFTSNFGGGGGFCPAEYSTCEDEDGDGCIDIDMGGGGGGDWVPLPTNCANATNQGIIVSTQWILNDFGRCATTAQCNQFRDSANVGRSESGPRWRCWASPYDEDTSGPHLLLGFRYRCASVLPTARVEGWIVTDLGGCATPAICQEKMASINASVVFAPMIAACWASAEQPETSGQHLVLARRRTSPSPETPADAPPVDPGLT